MKRALIVAIGLLVVVAGGLVACPPRNLPKPVPPAEQGNTGYYEPPAPGKGVDAAVGRPPGAACDSSVDCDSGICEGAGCGAAQGACVARERVCTYDIRPYCGCDGETFEASGTCPGRRYQHRGACKVSAPTPAPGGPLPVGAACQASAECDSGVCEGQGCGPDKPGACASRARACTRDRRQYCGCDGATFGSSGSCPGRRYASKGACP